MSKALYFIAGIVLATLVSHFWGSAPNPILTQGPAAQKPPLAGDIFVDLWEQNNSGESGRAGLVFLKDRIELGLDLSGAPYGDLQPAYIHHGTCDKLGSLFNRLTFPATGSSNSILQISPESFRKELPLVIDIRKSFKDEEVIIACGEIKL